MIIVIGCTLPISISSLRLALSIWGYWTAGKLKRLLIFAAVQAVLVDMCFHVLGPGPRLLAYTSVTFALLVLLFPTLKFGMRVVTYFTLLIISLFTELMVALVLLLFVSNKEMISNLPLLIAGYWPFCALLYLVALLMDKHNLHPGLSIRQFFKRKRDWRVVSLLILFAFLMLFITWIVAFKSLILPFQDIMDLVVLGVAALSFIILLTLLKIFTDARNEAIKSTQLHYIDDINRMFTTVRGQRHDFMNHVQVISSMVRMRKMDELEKYTQELVGETSEINEIMSIGNPALAALVQAKCAIAVSLKIEFTYDCTGFNSRELGPKSIDLVKIIGNLLDNAFDEVVKLLQEQRFVRLECRIEQNELLITVHNKGTYIPEDVQAKLFEAGFSTKAGTHRGLGLSIVKERLTYYNGTIKVQSDAVEGTTFQVKIPMKKNELVT
ncbi:sensor histidine kinase [Paenibacillus koleovorans]|uniref:sensor histidine kinase n=1 Tax=Paenibacillus koleovorans TaxID=121608 RepID=UPI001FE6221F|nr:ATP-binding protein [Paenibacillus koleovorans]